MEQGVQFGRYSILEELGEGGMGRVFKALDTTQNQTVAIKVLRSQEIGDDAVARFDREGLTMARLSHPNIVSVLDAGQEGDSHFIAMEFVTGQTLKEFLASHPEKRLDETLVLDITRQLGQAFDYVHSRGIIHRDIKPANVMITSGNVVKLADFGIAKTLALTTITQAGDVVGTAAYMPPEQALGEALDARSDLYALGCVLFECVAGRRAFPGDNAARIIFSQVCDTPSLPRSVAVKISPALQEIIFTLLAKNPDDRYQSAEELLAALRHMEEQSAPGARALQAAERRWAQILVGRESELVSLRKRVDAALQGQGSLAFLLGETGAGKSRLAHQLGDYARMRGASFHTARGTHQKERVPYQLWIDVMRAVLHLTPGAAFAGLPDDLSHYLLKLVPELVENLDEPAEAPAGPPEQQRARLFDAVVQFLVRVSQETPLTLFLDDLHWADEASILLLDHLAQHVPSERIFILGAYRQELVESRDLLATTVARMSRERISETIVLQPLNAEQTSEMIRKSLGGQALPALETLVFEKTEGNPYFVEEMLRSLLSEEVILMGERGWQIKDLSAVKPPGGIQAVVEDQLARLDEEGRSALAVAAVIGREFDFRVLQTVTELDEDNLTGLIDQALQAQLLAEQKSPGRERYAFVHAPVRDVLYEGVSPVRRKRLHLRIAEATEQIFADRLDDHIETLAHHFLEGNDPSKAASYAIKAGDRAAAVFAWSRARELYGLALDLLSPQELQQKADLMRELATTAFHTNDSDASLDYAKSALHLYKQLNDKRNVLNCHMVIQALYTAGAWDGAREYQALEHLRQIAALLEDDPDSLEKGIVYQRTAHIYLHTGEPIQALTWTQKAVDLYNRLDISRGTALGTALVYTGKIDEGVTYSEGNWQGVRKLGDLFITAIFGHELALTLALARDAPRARKWAEQVYKHLVGSGDASESQLNRPMILIYALLGDTDKGGELCQAQETIEQRTLAGCYFEDTAGIGFYHFRRGDWERARTYLEAAIAEHNKRKNFAAVNACSFVLGTIALEQGNLAEAKRLLHKSLDLCRNGGNVMFEMWVLPVLVELSLKEGRIEDAEEFVDRGFSLMAPDQNWYGLAGQMHLAKGMLDTAQRRWPAAEESFHQALAVNQQYELAWDQAKTLYEWGLMYALKKDRARAQEKLEEALARYQSVKAEKDIEKTLAAKEQLGRSWLARFQERVRGSD